jgi:hypothetical protein
MVAQISRPTVDGPQNVTPIALAGGAYTITAQLCTDAHRTLFAGQQRGVERIVLIECLHAVPEGVQQSAIAHKASLLALCHPNIAQALDIFVENDALYTVLCAGEGAPLCAAQSLTTAQAVTTGIHITNALGYLANHHHHLSPADISPATVFITTAGRARLTSLAALVGAHAQARDATTDDTAEQGLVFALGATLLRALTGWPGAMRATTVARELRRAHIAPDLADILTRALAHDPAGRFATVAEMRLALLRLQ